MTNSPKSLKIISKIFLKKPEKFNLNLFFKFPILFTFIITLVMSIGEASFEDIGMGARATGMNNAFTAVADDAFSVYYNPAGLNNILYPEVVSTYGKLMIGLDDDSNLGNSFLSYSHPLKIKYANGTEDFLGTVAIAWQEFKLDNLYRESVLYLSYARILYDRLRFGMNLKSMRREFGNDRYTENAIDQMGNARGDKDPIFEGGNSKRAFGLDVGFQYGLGRDEKYVLGLVLLNVNQPDMALKGSDRIPLTTKLGFLYRNNIADFSMDLVRRKTLKSTMDTIVNAAGEKWIDIGTYGMVGVRGGLGIGSREYRSLSLGASYRIYAVQFDYGFVLPLAGIEDTMGSHRVSLSFRFGDMDPDDDIGKLLMDEEALYQEAKEALEQAQRELELAKKEAELAQQEVEITRKKTRLERSGKALKRAKKAEQKAKNIYERASKIAYEFYKKRVANNIGLKERVIVLDKIIAKYKSTGISVKHLENELKSVKRKIKGARKDYRMEMKYYQKMKRSGANEEDSHRILNRIMYKYRPLGIDVKTCEQELKNLG